MVAPSPTNSTTRIICSYFHCDKNAFWSPVYYTQCNNTYHGKLVLYTELMLLSSHFGFVDFIFASTNANVPICLTEMLKHFTVVIYHKICAKVENFTSEQIFKNDCYFGYGLVRLFTVCGASVVTMLCCSIANNQLKYARAIENDIEYISMRFCSVFTLS